MKTVIHIGTIQHWNKGSKVPLKKMKQKYLNKCAIVKNLKTKKTVAVDVILFYSFMFALSIL